MSDVLAHDTPLRSFLEEPPFDRGAMTIGTVATPAPQPVSTSKPAFVSVIYDKNERAVAAIIIRGGSQDVYAKIYGLLPDGSRSFPLLAKAWKVYAVLTTPAWAEAKQYTPRPKGTDIEFI